MGDVLDFSNDPDFLDFSGESDLAPRQTYGTGALGAMGIAGPIAEGGLRGLATPFDLLSMGYNALAPKKYEIPQSYMPGNLLAEAVYPEAIQEQVAAYARPENKALGSAYSFAGRAPGTAANFLLSGGGLTKILGKAGQAFNSPMLQTIGTYAPNMQRADAYLGGAAGTAGALAEAISPQAGDVAESAVALSPLALATGKAATKIPYLGKALMTAGGGVAKGLDALLGNVPSSIGRYAVDKLTEGKPQLASLIHQPADQIASEFIQNIPGGSINRDAAEYALLQSTASQLPDPAIAGKVSELQLQEAADLGAEVKKIFPPGPVHDDATIGEGAQIVLKRVADTVKGQVDTAYTAAINDVKIPVNDAVQGVFKKALSSLNKATKDWIDPAPAVQKAKSLLREYISTANKAARPTISARRMDNIHKSLVDIQGRLTGSQQGMIGQVMQDLHSIAPKSLQTAWATAADHAEKFLKPETSFVSRLLNAQNTRTSGKFLLNPAEKVTAMLRKATARDFDEVAATIGEPQARKLFQMALFPEVSSYLEKGAKAAPRGSGAPTMQNRLKSLTSRRGLLEKVYGTSDYNKIAGTYQKLATLADTRMQAKGLKVSPYAPVKQFSTPLENTVLTINPGAGGRAYARPTSIFNWAYGGKQDEVNRLIYNQLAGGRGLQPVSKSSVAVQSLAEALNPVVRRAGTAPALALLASLSGSGEKPTLRTVPKIESGEPAVLDFSGEDFGMTTTGMDVLSGRATGLVQKIKKVESNNNPDAVSHKGAMGLMQLTPIAIKEVAQTFGLDASKFDPFDPVQNEEWGSKYLAIMLDRFGGDEKLALAAYNGGESYIGKLLKKKKASTWEEIRPFAYKETRDYVKKIMG